MKNALIASAIILGSFILGRVTKPAQTVHILQRDTLPPIIRIDTVRDTLLVPKYVQVKHFDTIRDTVDGNPIYIPVPISSYLFTDDSTYRIEMEGYNVKANSIEIYPRTITQPVIERVSVPTKQKRWGIGVSAGAALTPQGIRPYLGVGVHYQLIVF
jgi:hypothetical protein|nr:MAG TPA: hypothetical protein [Caudoviricetes sp.]